MFWNPIDPYQSFCSPGSQNAWLLVISTKIIITRVFTDNYQLQFKYFSIKLIYVTTIFLEMYGCLVLTPTPKKKPTKKTQQEWESSTIFTNVGIKKIIISNFSMSEVSCFVSQICIVARYLKKNHSDLNVVQYIYQGWITFFWFQINSVTRYI